MAVLGGAVLVSALSFVSPAQAAMTCQSVPGQTLGADVKVGPVVQRVPAVANIKLCYGTGTAPIASVTTSGGTCTSNCLTVTVGGGDVDLEGASVSWTEDGVAKTQALNPAPVPGPPATCVLSTGIPDAPNPDCFIAIGVDDPSPVIAPIVQTVNSTVNTVVQTAGNAVTITCSLIPDRYSNGYNYDFCTNPVGWTNATVDYAYKTACATVPDMYDPYYGYSADFCTNPIGWTNAVVNTVRYNPTVCGSISPAYDYNNGYYVYFCDDPVGWTRAVLSRWCIACEPIVIDELIYTIRRLINENVEIQIS